MTVSTEYVHLKKKNNVVILNKMSSVQVLKGHTYSVLYGAKTLQIFLVVPNVVVHHVLEQSLFSSFRTNLMVYTGCFIFLTVPFHHSPHT